MYGRLSVSKFEGERFNQLTYIYILFNNIQIDDYTNNSDFKTYQ